MKIEENQICRLCLRTDPSEIFEEIGGTIKEILEVLQLKLNSHINEEHVVCSNCMGNIHKCFGFKSTCMNIENLIVPFYNFESESKLCLREVYMHTNENKATDDIPKDQEICRLCMTFNKNSSCEPLLEIEKDKLQKCIPELNLNFTNEPVICDSCLNYLKFYSQFLQTCENTEEKIKKYCRSEAISGEDQINLNKVVQFIKNTFKNDRDVKMNVLDLGGLSSEIKENDVIKTEIIVKEENVEFDEEHARTDIKTDVGEYIMKAEMNEESFEPQDEELGMIHEQCKSEIKQSNFESFGDVHTSSQSITENISMYNPRHHVVTDQVLPEVKMKNLENLDEIKSVHNYQNSARPKTYSCQNCPFVTKYRSSLKVHKLTHGGKVYRCESCPYGTKIKGNLNTHMIVHRELSEVPVYKCEYCSFVTKHRRSIKVHVSAHRERSEATYTCESCPFVTRYKFRLKQHDKMIHRSSEVTLHTCDQCAFQTKYKKSLKGHMLTHAKRSRKVQKLSTHEGKVYMCASCPYGTKVKANLQRHMLVHRELSKVPMYKCQNCSFETKHKGSVKVHMLRVHMSTHQELSTNHQK